MKDLIYDIGVRIIYGAGQMETVMRDWTETTEDQP